MTVDKTTLSSIVALPSALAKYEQHITVFSLPHPSNTSSKQRVRLMLGSNGQLFELRSHVFSKSCKYNAKSDLADDKYHYTTDDQPIKSVFLTNKEDRSDSYVIESGCFQFAAKYDLTFNLIGYYHRNSIVAEERDYTRGTTEPQTCGQPAAHPPCLTARDYHDLLVDSHDPAWSGVPLETLQSHLSNIAEPIEEAGEIFYKITSNKITAYLILKVQKILARLPKSLPMPNNLPQELSEALKVVMSVNLLISLIPKAAYSNLVHFSPEQQSVDSIQLNISKAFDTYHNHQKSKLISEKEQELQLNAAMTVGLSVNSAKQPKKKVVKKSAINKKVNVASGKGSIDGFFKKSKQSKI
ncbi:hypothetical protein HG535_0A04520 [Zygotorulaspora mrakii]|uniref:Ribonuclease H2 subunit B n=1 Tax=Zygotorulaspora mrakii TaxID=42260 RepID=A0A7H9AY52_ZYGMR|nr:uncharacterized protein HG535_0A04520 [Zygotorulaspora mrakii]QLG70512.1 hypothetical protein HG535_0A04520 [Zygotorulaspora mrakii]